MTTNKPEVLGYCTKKDREPWERSNSYYLSSNPDENYTVPVIRLSDYEALQAELKKAVAALTDARFTLCDGPAGWQPIETAPDNTPVLVYWPDPMGDIAEVMAKMEGEWTGTMTLINPHVNPTHWQPLPAPPEVPE